jgi:hypothetical protein
VGYVLAWKTTPMKLIRTLTARRFLAVYAVLLITAALAYLTLVAGLGFYHDDWQLAAAKTAGHDIKFFFSVDRPFMGTFLAKSHVIFGDTPIGWHLLAFAARYAGALAFFWIVTLLWPDRFKLNIMMAVLFAVYPGFLQQVSAAAYAPHITSLAIALFSIFLSLAALKTPSQALRWLLLFAAAALALFYISLLEFMIGLEGVRLVLMGYLILKEKQTRPWLRLFLYAAPALAGMLGFAYWRLFIFVSKRVATDSGMLFEKYAADPLTSLLAAIMATINSALLTLFGAYYQPLLYNLNRVSNSDILVGLAVSGVAILLCYLLFRTLNDPAPGKVSSPDGDNTSPFVDALVIGPVIVLTALVPIILADRQVVFAFDLNRYTLPAIPGAVIFLGGLLSMLRTRLRHWPFLALLLISMLTHTTNMAYHRDHWALQQRFWWELAWRAPQIETGTTLMAEFPAGYRLMEGYNIYAPVGLIYHPPPVQTLSIYGEILNSDTIAYVTDQKVFERYTRTVPITYDYHRVLVASLPDPSACLHILGGDPLEVSAFENTLVRQAAPYSNPELIQVDAPRSIPPTATFGPEPAHGWCYYYQVASLARQSGDWDTILDLEKEAAAQGLSPVDASEWMPFLEAHLQTDDARGAEQIAERISGDLEFLENYCANYGQADKTGVSVLCPEK